MFHTWYLDWGLRKSLCVPADQVNNLSRFQWKKKIESAHIFIVIHVPVIIVTVNPGHQTGLGLSNHCGLWLLLYLGYADIGLSTQEEC